MPGVTLEKFGAGCLVLIHLNSLLMLLAPKYKDPVFPTSVETIHPPAWRTRVLHHREISNVDILHYIHDCRFRSIYELRAELRDSFQCANKLPPRSGRRANLISCARSSSAVICNACADHAPRAGPGAGRMRSRAARHGLSGTGPYTTLIMQLQIPCFSLFLAQYSISWQWTGNPRRYAMIPAFGMVILPQNLSTSYWECAGSRVEFRAFLAWVVQPIPPKIACQIEFSKRSFRPVTIFVRLIVFVRANRTPSTHSLFDFHFSSKIYFEEINPIL